MPAAALLTAGWCGEPPAVPDPEPPVRLARLGARKAEPKALVAQGGSRPGGDSRRPCSRSRRTLQVAAVSDTTDFISESLPWSFFCFVRRFWNQTLTCKEAREEGTKISVIWRGLVKALAFLSPEQERKGRHCPSHRNSRPLSRGLHRTTATDWRIPGGTEISPWESGGLRRKPLCARGQPAGSAWMSGSKWKSFSTKIAKPGCTLESATGVSGNSKKFKGFNLRSLEDTRVLWTPTVLGLFKEPHEAARKASAWACTCMC